MEINKSPQHIKNLFDEISIYYDKMNNFISLGLHYFVKKSALKMLNIKKSSNILDICCGTGDFTRIIRRISPKSKVIGLDFSSKMIEKAKQKQPREVFIYADCTNMPFKQEEFDYITVGFGLRNVENRLLALKEIYRVLKIGGKFLHLDFTGSIENFAWKIFEIMVPVITKIFKRNMDSYRYLLDSIDNYPAPSVLIKEFEQQGFKFLKQKNFIFGVINVIIFEK